MSNASQVVKVGIFMTVCLVLLGWLILRVEDWKLWGDEGSRVDAVFDSVAGLDDKAAVRLAGVRGGGGGFCPARLRSPSTRRWPRSTVSPTRSRASWEGSQEEARTDLWGAGES